MQPTRHSDYAVRGLVFLGVLERHALADTPADVPAVLR